MNAMAPSDQLPAGNPERTVAALWREVLEIQDSPAMSDNFFAMGGDSMAMVTLEFRIQEETGVSLPPGAVLAAPTLEELVALVRRELASRASE